MYLPSHRFFHSLCRNLLMHKLCMKYLTPNENFELSSMAIFFCVVMVHLKKTNGGDRGEAYRGQVKTSAVC